MLPLLACTEDFASIPGPPDGVRRPGDSVGADSPSADSPSLPGDSAPDSPTGPVEIAYPDRRVGIFYLAWHAYAAAAWAARGDASPSTVEAVIQSGGSFADLVYDAGLYGSAAGFHWHQEPELGFYCLYRSEDGAGPVADCADVEDIARTHASQLWDAGIDFVYLDLTNLPDWSEFGEVIGLRPLEVLLEEWAALRRAGTPTPQIAAWVPLNASADPMGRHVLDAYAAADPELLFAPEGRPVLFYVASSSTDAGLVAEVEARGVLPVPMWGNLGAADLAAGTAGWMQPCTDGGDFSTLLSPSTPCDQGYTTNSPLGTVLSVSRSYQVGYASLPFQASGRLGGLTLQKQMETALAVQPDVLIFNAWNEHLAQPQANPYDASYGGLRRSMGVTTGGDDSADWLWVDMYGADLNRDLEPTVQDGGAGYALLQSCLRVWRSGASSCADAGEACCQLAEGRSLVWSVRSGVLDSWGDHVPTVDRAEVDELVAAGWTEACNPFYGPPGLCGGGTGDGPFGLFPSGGEGRVAIYRCYSGADHFLSTDGACEGRTYERLLGHAAAAPSSEMPRPLHRCYNSSGVAHLHWLDASCPSGTTDEGILGYVQ